MKKIFLLLCIVFSINTYSQKSSEILPVLNVDTGINPDNFIFIQAGTNYWNKTSASNLVFPISQITNLQTSLNNLYPLAGNPSNFLTSEVDGSVTNELEAVGIVEFYTGTTAPTGYLMCDGAAVSRTTYSTLFAVCSTTYGSGDGSTTFNLPDLRQRFPLTKAASGTGSTLGATGGQIDHVHTVDPPSTTTGAPSATVQATILAGGAASTTHTHTVDISVFNSGTANPPYIVLNAIIKY